VNQAIGRVHFVLACCFVLLIVRQFWYQIGAHGHFSGDRHNPRAILGNLQRAPIFARDGSLLAYTADGARHYPLGSQLAQTVGYASQRYGDSGLEAEYADRLRGVGSAANPFEQLHDILTGSTPRSSGAALVTTIDPGLQRMLFDELSPYGRAAGIVLDPRTGEILAIVSIPSFDPNDIDHELVRLHDDTSAPFLNRVLNGLYPPGSTVKIFTAAAALQAGTVTMQSTFNDPGFLHIGNAVIHDNEGESTGARDLTGAFALSSNVDFANIALSLGRERWFRAVGDWKLGQEIPLDLPVARDRVPAPEEVTPSVLAQLGFGQADLLLTPLRVALLAATIADDGSTPRPILVHGTGAGALVLANPISPDVADEVRTLMRAVVIRGTGTAAALPNVQVAGKTGTATNSSGRAHAWFVAYAPADQPRVVVAVIVENGGYGGTVAAPIVRRLITSALTARN
jgi:peptidoglycan glycosyltransferase